MRHVHPVQRIPASAGVDDAQNVVDLLRSLLSLCCFASVVLIGCATPRVPEIPEYHPASASAPQAARAPLFDILNVDPLAPPELPVPEGANKSPEHHPPKMGEMDMQHGQMPMGHESNEPSDHEHPESHQQPQDSAPMPEGVKKPAQDETQHHAMEMEHAEQHEAKPRQHELHGVVDRPGMKPGQAEPKPFEQRIKRGEAEMDPIVIPSEQRGMKTDETLYHEHEPPYSTRIIHPRRPRYLQPVEGEQIWVCPMHPKVNVETPGGRCPKCRAILVPVKVPENG